MASRRLRVLVVDGDAEIRDVVHDLLLDEDFDVEQASNVDDALLTLRRAGFSVLLCHLPLLRSRNGLLGRSARDLRPDMRIVAMTASGGRAGGDEANANLAKPFGRAQLLKALRRAYQDVLRQTLPALEAAAERQELDRFRPRRRGAADMLSG